MNNALSHRLSQLIEMSFVLPDLNAIFIGQNVLNRHLMMTQVA